MTEELPNRPSGSRRDDFSELGDWTITDIATAPKTAPEDRKNAEAEIAKREKAGIYKPDEAPREVLSDLLSHGYALENGKILYPKPEYKSWLKSDRSEPIPSGIVRETIDDRLEAEKQKANETIESNKMKLSQERNSAIGEEAIRNYDNSPTYEKVISPSRHTTEKDEIANERKNKKKIQDEIINSQRDFKYQNRGENNSLNPRKKAEAEVNQNMPLAKVENQPNEYAHSLESVSVKTEKLYNFYKKDFSKYVPKWVSFGVSSRLEQGEVNSSTDSLLQKGFWLCEEERIHKRIDPNDVLLPETIEAEAKLKNKIIQELIPTETNDLSKQKNRNRIIPEKPQLRKGISSNYHPDLASVNIPKNLREKYHERQDILIEAKRNGFLYAIESGARIDKRSGKTVYSIPSQKGDEVVRAMKEVGINPDDHEEDKNLMMASYQGFANIIEAIKSNDKETEKGFKTLDWYFDTFNYKERISDFLGVMSAFQENTDDKWIAKFEEYLNTRDEIKKYLKQLEQKPIPKLTQVEEISQEELTKMYEDLVKKIAEQPAILRLFPDIERYPVYNHTGAVLPVNLPPTSVQKLGRVVTEFARIKVFDSNANVYKGIFVDSNNRKKQYMIIRYGMRNSNIAIAAPIENLSNDASFVWIGQTGDNRDGWMEAFVQNPDPNTPTSKYQAHQREDVRAHNHIAAMKTRGLNAIDNMWYNIYKDINQRAV